MAAKRYRVNGPNFASEIIDGEAVIINLEKGTYYSLTEAGANIWGALKDGATDHEVLEAILQRYRGEREEIESALVNLIGELEREGILVMDEAPEHKPEHHISPECQSAAKPAFERPVLSKYTDMEAILMLDPIHEVDETGWPSARRPQ